MRISRPELLEGLLLVVFEEVSEQDQQEKQKSDPTGGRSKGRVAVLEKELKNVKEHLQTTIEELETSNEELQSANEELMTVNAEAQEKIEQLTRSTNDMKNLLASAEMATVFLDNVLRIRSFTLNAVRLFKLIQSDIGRPISDITNIIQYDGLEDDM